MGVLYDLTVKIDKAIAVKQLDASAVRGKIALQAGFMLSFVTASTPDDPAKIEKLKKAVALVMKVSL
jgi:hypothetical protein